MASSAHKRRNGPPEREPAAHHVGLKPSTSSRWRLALGAAAAVAAAASLAVALRGQALEANRPGAPGPAAKSSPALDVDAKPRPNALPTSSKDVILPKGIKDNFKCALRCSHLTTRDRTIVEQLYQQVGCKKQGPSVHTVCATSPEQLCVGACGGGQQNMAQWLPGTFGEGSPELPVDWLDTLRAVYHSHRQCASRCASEGVVVDSTKPDALRQGLEVLRQCGVVQLAGAYHPELLDGVQDAIRKLHARKDYDKLVDNVQLHDGRWQVYLPFEPPFNSLPSIGVSNLVLEILTDYFAEHKFGIDHVSVLTSSPGSGNQSLHPDVPYFMRQTVSVHTALADVTREMGPTFFCPCSGEVLESEGWPASAAIKMTLLKHKDCIGSSIAPALTKRGTVTIYDSAMFHKGLANGSGRDRPVLKLEVGADGFPDKRNYLQHAPKHGKNQARLFRQAFGPPRMGPA